MAIQVLKTIFLNIIHGLHEMLFKNTKVRKSFFFFFEPFFPSPSHVLYKYIQHALYNPFFLFCIWSKNIHLFIWETQFRCIYQNTQCNTREEKCKRNAIILLACDLFNENELLIFTAGVFHIPFWCILIFIWVYCSGKIINFFYGMIIKSNTN